MKSNRQFVNKINENEKEVIILQMPFDLKELGYGIRRLGILYCYIKDNKAITIKLNCPCYLNSVKHIEPEYPHIKAIELMYHSPYRLNDYDSKSDKCRIIKGDKCYSVLNDRLAQEIWLNIQAKARNNEQIDIEDEIFNELKKYWKKIFEKGETHDNVNL